MPVYSEKVMEHFMHPRNVGEIENPDGVGEVGNPVCGDMMTFYIKVQDNHLSDIKFKTFGCGAAIAVSSIVSEMAMGKTLDEAMAITSRLVADELGGLPKNKFHCSNLGAEGLHQAIEDYLSKKAGKKEVKDEKEARKRKPEKCACPYCEEEVLVSPSAFCQFCGIVLRYCPRCRAVFGRETTICPHCGGKLE